VSSSRRRVFRRTAELDAGAFDLKGRGCDNIRVSADLKRDEQRKHALRRPNDHVGPLAERRRVGGLLVLVEVDPLAVDALATLGECVSTTSTETKNDGTYKMERCCSMLHVTLTLTKD
jgi:hypothetical protein